MGRQPLGMGTAVAFMIVACVGLIGRVVEAQIQKPDYNVALDESPSADEEAFTEWAKSKNVRFDAIALANFTNPIFSNFKLRGLKANRDVKAGEMLLSVPGDMMLSTVNALSDAAVGRVFKENVGLFADDQVILTVFLIHELLHPADSKWAQHLAVLPTRFHTSCEFSSNELRQLEGSVLFDETKARSQLFLDEYNSLFPMLAQRYPNLFDMQAVSFTMYKYARLLVQTRAFGMHVGGRVVIAIVPVGDMMNHNPRSKVSWKYDYAADEFRMYSGDDIPANTQVYNNYGPRSNRRLLLDFGFTIEDNPFDFVEMPAPVSTGLSSDKSAVLSDRGLSGKLSFMVRLGELPDDLLLAARVARATSEEIAAFRHHMEMAFGKAGSMAIPKVNASISIRNEIAALSWLQDTAQAQLSRYRDTYENDLALLEASVEDVPRSMLNSIIVRFSEKRIYKFMTDFAAVNIPLLAYYDRFTTGNPLTNSRMALAAADYMRNVMLPLQGSLLERAFKESQFQEGSSQAPTEFDREAWGVSSAHNALIAT